ncbi:MAG: GMC family oxidoreductase [Minwuia sp.]|uniref:GMC family oxidoreductase n=1 Tax=Minwuia sp. TaxID=2493630 RepID=UPI003A87E3EC
MKHGDDAAPFEGEWDYIICGAGTAGCLLANRLSADPKKRVLLLEGGRKDSWIWFHIPVGYLFAIGNPKADWMFRTEAEPGLNGRALIYPRGKTLGGCSAINGMISMRGQAEDYRLWRQQGLDGWGWEDVQPVYRRLDQHFLGPDEHHADDGEYRVEQQRLSWEVLDAIRDAAAEMGVPKVADFNTGDNEGVSYFHVNQRKGTRWSAARGFLKPVMDRSNLKVVTEALIDRVTFEGKRASGVRFLKGGQALLAKARGEVILSAGAVASPVILQRSGVGPGEWLSEEGVEVVHEMPGLGRNLQDHLQQRAIYKVHGVKTLNETYHSLLGKAGIGLSYALFRKGPMTMAPSQLGMFTRSGPDHDRANIQFHIQPLSLDKFGDPLHRFPAVTVSACNLRPTSRGTIRMRSADPSDAPLIRPNYLDTEADRIVAADAIRVTRRLMGQPALAKYRPEEYLPGPDVGDDQESLAKAAGDIGTTIFHPVGTARMGRLDDPNAVTDERLRVIGLEGLRVIDASVMPTITSGNTNTPVLMIAEKGAEYVLTDAL